MDSCQLRSTSRSAGYGPPVYGAQVPRCLMHRAKRSIDLSAWRVWWPENAGFKPRGARGGGIGRAAARQIIGAVRQRRAEVILTPAAQLVSRVAGLAPGLTSEVLHLVQPLALPAPPGQPLKAASPSRDMN